MIQEEIYVKVHCNLKGILNIVKTETFGSLK